MGERSRAGRALILRPSACRTDTQSVGGLGHELGPYLEVLQSRFIKCLCQIYKLGFLEVSFTDFCTNTVV